MSGMETLTVTDGAAVGVGVVPEVVNGDVVELRVDLDVTQLGPPDHDERRGLIPFGAQFMMRAVATDVPVEPRLDVTMTKVATSTATGTRTAPSSPGGSPDVSGDELPDEGIKMDRN